MKNHPQTLKKGDSIILVSPARKISLEEMKPFIQLLEGWGLQVLLGKNILREYHQYAGTNQERLEDFQEALDHPDAKAILCARGGYGSVRIIDQLDFAQFIQDPKWVIGYSDITVFHEHINQNFNIETLHATMPIDYTKSTPETFESLRKVLFGEPYVISVQNAVVYGSTSKIEGKIVGGNLSIIYSLLGSPSSIDTSGKILFIEDLDEYLYHIDRMMVNLKRNNLLKNIKALIVGGMSDMQDNTISFGKTAKEIILDACCEYDFPIIFNFPSGHIKDNRALIFNKKCQLTIGNDSVSITF